MNVACRLLINKSLVKRCAQIRGRSLGGDEELTCHQRTVDNTYAWWSWKSWPFYPNWALRPGGSVCRLEPVRKEPLYGWIVICPSIGCRLCQTENPPHRPSPHASTWLPSWERVNEQLSEERGALSSATRKTAKYKSNTTPTFRPVNGARLKAVNQLVSGQLSILF